MWFVWKVLRRSRNFLLFLRQNLCNVWWFAMELIRIYTRAKPLTSITVEHLWSEMEIYWSFVLVWWRRKMAIVLSFLVTTHSHSYTHTTLYNCSLPNKNTETPAKYWRRRKKKRLLKLCGDSHRRDYGWYV